MIALFFFTPFHRITFLNELCCWKNSIWLLVSVVFCLPKEIPRFYAGKLLYVNFKTWCQSEFRVEEIPFLIFFLTIKAEQRERWEICHLMERELGSFVQSFNKWVSSVRFSRYSSEQGRLYYISNQSHKMFFQLLVIFEWLLAIFLRRGRP